MMDSGAFPKPIVLPIEIIFRTCNTSCHCHIVDYARKMVVKLCIVNDSTDLLTGNKVSEISLSQRQQRY